MLGLKLNHVSKRSYNGPFYKNGLTEVKTWINIHMHWFIWDVFYHLYSCFNGRLTKSPLKLTLVARFMGPTWGPSGTDSTQVGPMLVP